MAIRCDAATDYLSRTTNLPIITSATIMAWWKVVTATASGAFCFFGTHASPDSYLVYVDTDGLTVSMFNGIGVVGSGVTLTAGTWAHIAMTVAGTGAGQLLGYVNAVQNMTLDGNGAVAASAMQLGTPDGVSFINGSVAAVKIYSAALTAAEIAQERRFYRPVRTANINGWYPCLQNVGTDFSGNGNTMTLNGTLALEDGPPIPFAPRPRWGRIAAAAGPTILEDTFGESRRYFVETW